MILVDFLTAGNASASPAVRGRSDLPVGRQYVAAGLDTGILGDLDIFTTHGVMDGLDAIRCILADDNFLPDMRGLAPSAGRRQNTPPPRRSQSIYFRFLFILA